MNKSDFINPKKCASCGMCCKSFQISYSKKSNKILLSEVERFRLLDTDLIEVHEDKERFRVEFKIPCKHLLKNKQGYFCKIYKIGRPELCKHYPYKDTTACLNKISKR